MVIILLIISQTECTNELLKNPLDKSAVMSLILTMSALALDFAGCRDAWVSRLSKVSTKFWALTCAIPTVSCAIAKLANLWQHSKSAVIADDFKTEALGFEPRNVGTKTRCLTTWRRLIAFTIINIAVPTWVMSSVFLPNFWKNYSSPSLRCIIKRQKLTWNRLQSDYCLLLAHRTCCQDLGISYNWQIGIIC